jgi:2-polyprenyl-3-methyl-5-hydroxy-6-metoxy-1,4-benzoquinol methylase
MTHPLACPICSHRQTRVIAPWRLGYTINECDGCGVLFSDPLPTEAQLLAFYQGFLHKKPSAAALEGEIKKDVRALRELLDLEQGAGLQFLDHGGGTGVTFAAAKRLGFDAFFNDVDQQSIDFVRDQHGLDEDHCIPDLSKTQQRFDVIVSDNVIEHVPDPIAVLRELVAVLRPGGFLVIKTPWAKASEQLFYPKTVVEYAKVVAERSGWAAALQMPLSARVWCCDPPRHLYGFTSESLIAAAKSAGVPEAWCSISGYTNSLLTRSLTEAFFEPPAGVMGLAKRALVAPLIGPELALKVAHFALRKLRALTPIGLALRVTRPA